MGQIEKAPGFATDQTGNAFYHQLLNIASGQLRIGKLIGCMLLLSHWNGCVQFLVPYLLEFPDNSWVVINGLQVVIIHKDKGIP